MSAQNVRTQVVLCIYIQSSVPSCADLVAAPSLSLMVGILYQRSTANKHFNAPCKIVDTSSPAHARFFSLPLLVSIVRVHKHFAAAAAATTKHVIPALGLRRCRREHARQR